MFKLKKRNKIVKSKVNKKPGFIKRAILRIAKIKILRRFFMPLVKLARYFKESWQELKLVRWPNTKATWSLTFAVIFFTLMFVVLILLLDFGFKELFNLIIK